MELNLTPEQEQRCKDLRLTDDSKIRIVKNLIDRYNSKDKELGKYRDCSSLKDGWQTSNLAKKQRKADVISQEKTTIRHILYNDWNIEI